MSGFYDVFFGQLIKLLAALGLEMHTPQKGSTWVCKRRPKHPRFANREASE